MLAHVLTIFKASSFRVVSDDAASLIDGAAEGGACAVACVCRITRVPDPRWLPSSVHVAWGQRRCENGRPARSKYGRILVLSSPSCHVADGCVRALQYGALDLGGGSTQIAFVPQSPPPAPWEYTLDIFTREYKIYTHSFLGYGFNEARYRLASVERAALLAVTPWRAD